MKCTVGLLKSNDESILTLPIVIIRYRCKEENRNFAIFISIALCSLIRGYLRRRTASVPVHVLLAMFFFFSLCFIEIIMIVATLLFDDN